MGKTVLDMACLVKRTEEAVLLSQKTDTEG